jgi:hypothetical protein
MGDKGKIISYLKVRHIVNPIKIKDKIVLKRLIQTDKFIDGVLRHVQLLF